MRCNGTAPISLAFAHLNLRFNPFGELDPAERARVAVLPPLEVRSGEVVQVMGEAGRGKTTHLLAWHAATPASGYEYVPEGSVRLRTRALPAVFFADEAQRLCRRDLDRAESFASSRRSSSHWRSPRSLTALGFLEPTPSSRARSGSTTGVRPGPVRGVAAARRWHRVLRCGQARRRIGASSDRAHTIHPH